jgi:aspartyl-tRNA(Asn)/glutamyl-tRNA(Gln) amidotransferase subunit B
VSVHRPGEPFGTRCEIKNLNSLRSLGRAIEYEAKRQIEMIDVGDAVRQETRHWNEADGRTHTLRVKEEAEDYRYFPEPDLVPLDPGDEWVGRIDAAMPALPADRRAALSDAAGAAAGDRAVAIAVERGLDTLALEAIAAGADRIRVLTHVEHNLAVDGAEGLDPAKLAALVAMETSGELTPTQAKAVLAELVATGEDPAAIAKAKGYEPMGADALGGAVDEVIAANAEQWTRFVEGDDKVRGNLTRFFVGQVMKATKGQADGKAVTALLRVRAGI